MDGIKLAANFRWKTRNVFLVIVILQIEWTQSDFNYNGMINGHFIYLWNLPLV